MVWPCVLKDYQVGETLATVNDQINARGSFVSLRVQAGAFNRYVVICFRQKYRESLKILEYPSINN